jgi:hypothetical protein
MEHRVVQLKLSSPDESSLGEFMQLLVDIISVIGET